MTPPEGHRDQAAQEEDDDRFAHEPPFATSPPRKRPPRAAAPPVVTPPATPPEPEDDKPDASRPFSHAKPLENTTTWFVRPRDAQKSTPQAHREVRAHRTCLDHARMVSCVASLTKDRVVSGSFDRTLKIWNAQDGALLKTLSGHSRYVQCVAALGDDRVVSGSCDGTARVWSCDSGECLHVLRGHSALVTCMSVLSNEQTLVTGSFDHTCLLYTSPSPRDS